MYEIVYEDCKWWISKDGKILRNIGGFIDPISPKVILEELNGEI